MHTGVPTSQEDESKNKDTKVRCEECRGVPFHFFFGVEHRRKKSSGTIKNDDKGDEGQKDLRARERGEKGPIKTTAATMSTVITAFIQESLRREICRPRVSLSLLRG